MEMESVDEGKANFPLKHLMTVLRTWNTTESINGPKKKRPSDAPVPPTLQGTL